MSMRRRKQQAASRGRLSQQEGQARSGDGARAELPRPRVRNTGAASKSWPAAPISRRCCTANSPKARRSGLTRFPAAASSSDGRIAGHGRHDRLHQAAARTDCPLRKAAGRSCSRAADVLCHRVHPRRIRQPGAGREPPVPSHQDRRQRQASGEPRRHRHFLPGLDPGHVRPRPLADRHLPGRHSLLGIVGQAHARRR